VLDDPSLIEDIDVPETYETPEEYAESHRPHVPVGTGTH
jgi:hypothetical protein